MPLLRGNTAAATANIGISDATVSRRMLCRHPSTCLSRCAMSSRMDVSWKNITTPARCAGGVSPWLRACAYVPSNANGKRKRPTCLHAFAFGPGAQFKRRPALPYRKTMPACCSSAHNCAHQACTKLAWPLNACDASSSTAAAEGICLSGKRAAVTLWRGSVSSAGRVFSLSQEISMVRASARRGPHYWRCGRYHCARVACFA